MLIGKVTEIGSKAISQKDPIIILFGEQATEDLRTVSVIQSFEDEGSTIELAVGKNITFDEQEYTIQEVGDLANENFNTIGHVSLIFSEVPEEGKLQNGVYLEPFEKPEITVGTTIRYEE